jgi:hypothetical protein
MKVASFSRQRWLDVGAEGVVARKVAALVAHAQVVGVHMVAGSDGLGGEADDLVVSSDWLTGGDVSCGHFVAGGDQALDLDAFYRGAAYQLASGYQYVVGGVESDEGCHFSSFLSVGCR